VVADPVVISHQQEQKNTEEKQKHDQHELQLAVREEEDYQQAIADSLGLPYTTPVPPSPFMPSSDSRVALSTVAPTVRTIPYRPPKITQHLNDAWMLTMATQNSTTKARKVPVVRKANLDNRFTIIFWGKVRYTVSIIRLVLIFDLE
jgi:hypothetical protein